MTDLVKVDADTVSIGYGLTAAHLIQISDILKTLRKIGEKEHAPGGAQDEMTSLIDALEEALKQAAEKYVDQAGDTK